MGGLEPRWSADGRELYFWQGDAVMAVAVQSDPSLSFDAPVELFRSAYAAEPIGLVRSYDVARDGRFLMFEAEDAGSPAPASIVVVQNWFEELRRRAPRSSSATSA